MYHPKEKKKKTFDNSALGILEEMYIFEKDKKPRPQK